MKSLHTDDIYCCKELIAKTKDTVFRHAVLTPLAITSKKRKKAGSKFSYCWFICQSGEREREILTMLFGYSHTHLRWVLFSYIVQIQSIHQVGQSRT